MVGGVGGMGVILQRWLTALVLGICLLGSVVFFNPLGFEVLVSVLAGAAYWEWLRMTLHRTSRVLCIGGGIVLGALVLFSVKQPILGVVILGSAMFWWFCVLVVMITAGGRRDSSVFPTSVLPGSLIVLAGGIAICWLQQRGPANGLRLIEFLVLVWAVDCGSFFVGRRWGRHKLAPALSPGKTVQGALGGAVSVLAVSGCIYLIDDSLAETMLSTWLSLVLAVYLMCVVGDLYESAAKRNAGVKDSGTLLPGHGGILDRIDSVLAASPIYYVVLFW